MLLQQSNTNALAHPATPTGRLESLDVLRGIALLGVFITHFICEFYGLAFTPVQAKAIITTPVDSYVEKLLRLIFFDKARGMFSFLFGVGFYFQLVKARKTGVNFNLQFIKRLSVLLLFGLCHYYFLFKGDVLRFYAVLGLLLLICYKLKPTILLIASILLAVVFPSICTLFENDLFLGSFNTPATLAIFGQFLFGFWVAQKNVFSNLSIHRDKLRTIFLITLTLNIVLYGTRSLFAYAERSGFYSITESTTNVLDITFLIGIQAMILTIISGILLLYMNPSWKKGLSFFIAPGQMTLTNYIAQSAIAILIFHIGLYELLGTLAAFIVSICLCALQVYFSKWWLVRFKSGPLESLWRSLTSVTLERPNALPVNQPQKRVRTFWEISFKGF